MITYFCGIIYYFSSRCNFLITPKTTQNFVPNFPVYTTTSSKTWGIKRGSIWTKLCCNVSEGTYIVADSQWWQKVCSYYIGYKCNYIHIGYKMLKQLNSHQTKKPVGLHLCVPAVIKLRNQLTCMHLQANVKMVHFLWQIIYLHHITMGLSITIHYVTVPWPSYICTFIMTFGILTGNSYTLLNWICIQSC